MSKMGKVIHLILKRAAFGHAITFPFDHEFFSVTVKSTIILFSTRSKTKCARGTKFVHGSILFLQLLFSHLLSVK